MDRGNSCFPKVKIVFLPETKGVGRVKFSLEIGECRISTGISTVDTYRNHDL